MAIDLKCAKAMLGYGMLHILNLLENSKLMECVSYIIKAMQIHEEETAIEYAKMRHAGDLVEVDDEKTKSLFQPLANK